MSEARARLPQLVREAERGASIRLTRRGQAVAVMISLHDYRRLQSKTEDVWTAIERFRNAYELADLDAEGVYENARDRSIGRDVDL